MVALRRIPAAVVEAFWRRVDDVIGSEHQNDLAVRAVRAETLVRAFYVYLMAVSYDRVLATTNAWIKDWPVETRLDLALTSWLPVDIWREVAVGCALLLLVTSLLAAAIPRWRIPRILAIASFLLLEAMKFDRVGKISHASHPVVWVGIAFCFLPVLKSDSRERCREYLASFFGAQVLISLLYCCAGLAKVIGIAHDWEQGVTWLHPEALPLLLSAKWRGGAYYPTGAFFLSNPWAGWLSHVGVLYLEIGALFAVFRRRLHRPWAVGLLTMHAMVLLTMRIEFQPSVFLVGFILLASPFAPARLELKATVLDLPLVRLGHRWLRARRRARAEGDRLGDSRPHVPWVPSSQVMKLWIPVLVAVYLSIAFGNLDRGGRSHQELYPISAMPMFMRIDSSDTNFNRLNRLRSKIEAAKESEAVDDGRSRKGRQQQ